MLLILLLIYWTHFLDLTANLCLFQDFRFKIKLIICPTIPPFLIFLLTTIEDLLKLGTSPLFFVLITQ